MEKEIFSPMAIDALGEMMNISLGSSATAVSNMLDHRVDITTPKVSVVEVGEFTLGNLEPAMGVEIKYVEGLEGSNIMLLKRSDIKVIVDILMGGGMTDEEFELNELTISAVCELMNQMMGSASTALSDFLGFSVNISTPEPFELEDLEDFKKRHLPQKDKTLVVVRFALKIENALESEFMNVMSTSLARELLSGLGLAESSASGSEQAAQKTATQSTVVESASTAAPGGGSKMSQEEIEELMMGTSARGSTSIPTSPPSATQAPAAYQMPPQMTSQGEIPPEGQAVVNGQMGYPPMYYPSYPYLPQMGMAQPKLINTQPLEMKPIDVVEELGQEQAQNLELILEVPLQVTVEIGRTRRKVQDILELSKGSLVVLDKLAGDQVDLFVNGKCIARGDVVVVEDNFGVRITEIVQKPTIEGVSRG